MTKPKKKTKLSHPCKGCGEHQSIAGALLKSDYWKRWYKYASQGNTLFDVDETQEIDAMSDEHFKAFMLFSASELPAYYEPINPYINAEIKADRK